MRRVLNWQVLFAIGLVALSVFFYMVHYLIFGDAHHIFLYLIGDVAFLFLDVLIVMLVLHRLLVYREKKSIRKKLNMVIGTFYSEVGTGLLEKFSSFDKGLADYGGSFVVEKGWAGPDFRKAKKAALSRDWQLVVDGAGLLETKEFLSARRQFLLTLLENPNLLEHESFTELLWAVFHLADELSRRRDLLNAPETDRDHLAGDMKRAYGRLVVQWLDYMRHLKDDYPYLFSLAMRTNPFDASASVEVR